MSTAITEAIAAGNLRDTPGFRDALAVAAEHAPDVDRHASFPKEAIDALRSAGALGWGVPRELGGTGASLAELGEAALDLSRRCSSTGMIFAMHQIQVACLARHRGNNEWIASYLERLVREQRLIASATSEAGVGGDLRKSVAALQSPANGSAPLHFEKNASTISYGAHADDLLTTVRRHPDADSGDQVLVLTLRGDAKIEQTGEWDTMGMRGTCSPAFTVRATCAADQVMPAPFSTIAAETMVPWSHILWSHVWLGMAADAFHRAQTFVREQARKSPGSTPPSALRLSELSLRMAAFRALVNAAVKEHTELDRSSPSSIGYTVRLNNLKIAASEAAVEVCQGALRVCGLAGYRNSGPYSITRHLRDAYSASLMIANDRLYATNAALLLVHRENQ